MPTYKTSYSDRVFMDPENHGIRCFSWSHWINGRSLVGLTSRPALTYHMAIMASPCWAAALTELFGEEGVTANFIRYLPDYQGSNVNTKFYYHTRNCQIWRLYRVPEVA